MAIKNPYIRSERSILILHLLEKRMILAQLKSSSEYSVALKPRKLGYILDKRDKAEEK